MSSRTKASGVADAGAKADSIRQRTLHESSDQGCLPVHNGVLPSEEKVPQKQSGSQCSLHVWSRKTLLNRKDIPKHLQFNPYIETGYRPLLSAWGCIMSLFYFHNETINIITHGELSATIDFLIDPFWRENNSLSDFHFRNVFHGSEARF